jgi:hypothetical protein
MSSALNEESKFLVADFSPQNVTITTHLFIRMNNTENIYYHEAILARVRRRRPVHDNRPLIVDRHILLSIIGKTSVGTFSLSFSEFFNSSIDTYRDDFRFGGWWTKITPRKTPLVTIIAIYLYFEFIGYNRTRAAASSSCL